LGRIFEEVLQIVVTDAGLLLQRGPIAIAGLVKGNNEVEDRLRLGGDLAEGDACAGEGCSIEGLARVPRKLHSNISCLQTSSK
jgi:hypothetical protein